MGEKEVEYINKFTKSKYGAYIIILFFVITINGIYLRLNNLTNVDEFSTLAVPAILAGKDWSALSSVAGFHGYGASILLTPFFFFISDGVLLYKISLILCLLFRVICTFISFWIAKNVFELGENKSLIVALVCNFGMLSSDDGAALSSLMEVPLTLITLVFLFFVLKAQFGNKKRYWIFAGVVLAYGSLIHSRILIVYFSVIIILLIYALKYRKLNKTIAILLGISFLISYVLFSQLDSIIMDLVYKTDSGVELITTTSGIATTRIATYASWLFDGDLLQSFIKLFLSLMGAFSFYSFGTIWIFLYACVWYIINNIGKNNLQPKEQMIMGISLFGVSNFLIMNYIFNKNFPP